MANKHAKVRPSIQGDKAPLNASEVASILGYKPETAQKWIAKHQKRLKAWKTGTVSGRWRVKLSALKQCCKQLGINIG
jgi:hypothetical protein